MIYAEHTDGYLLINSNGIEYLRVRLSELRDLRLSLNISKNSYQNAVYAFLAADDAILFRQTKQAKEENVSIRKTISKDLSKQAQYHFKTLS